MSTEASSPKRGSNPRASSAPLTIALALAIAPAIGLPALADEMPEFEKGFGQETGMSLKDLDETDKDRLKIGGTLWNEFQYLHFGSGSPVDPLFTNPNSLWLYLDA